MTPSRRAAIAGGMALLAGAAAPVRASAASWIAYGGRLRERLADAGGGRFDDRAGRELMALTNAARRDAGATPLAWHEALAETARAHAADLAQRNYVEHVSPEGFDPTDRLGLLARRLLCTTSENIAYRRGAGPAEAADVMEQWRDSPPHWQNLLRPKHTHAAFGVARLHERTYAVGLYARPDGELPAAVPFRPSGAGPILAAVDGLGEPYVGAWLEDQLRGGLRAPLAGAANPGVYRLRIDRRVQEQTFESLYGPIFVWRHTGAAATLARTPD